MKIELEKKYDITEHDYIIIKEQCLFVSDKSVQDYYLDDNTFTLFQNNHKLRIRNGKYELKIKPTFDPTSVSRAIEIDDEEEIEKILSKYNLSTDTVTGILAIDTQVEKYKYDFNGYEFIIDIQRYKYNNRYEVELLLDDDTDICGETLIEDFRTHLGLISRQQDQMENKVITCAMHENLALYETMLGIKI